MCEVYTSLDKQAKKCIVLVILVWSEKNIFSIGGSQGPVGLAGPSNMYRLPGSPHLSSSLHNTELYRGLCEEQSCSVQAELLIFSHVGGIEG